MTFTWGYQKSLVKVSFITWERLGGGERSRLDFICSGLCSSIYTVATWVGARRQYTLWKVIWHIFMNIVRKICGEMQVLSSDRAIFILKFEIHSLYITSIKLLDTVCLHLWHLCYLVCTWRLSQTWAPFIWRCFGELVCSPERLILLPLKTQLGRIRGGNQRTALRNIW